jgi:hypothetical protein
LRPTSSVRQILTIGQQQQPTRTQHPRYLGTGVKAL